MSAALDVFDLAPTGYAVLDASGLVLQANAELLGLLGLAREEVEHRRSLPDLVTVGGRIYFETHLFPILQVEGSVREVALDLVAADGTRVPVLFNADLLTDPDPAATRIVAVLARAEDRRRYESDLLAATRAAEAAERRATELARTLQGTLIPPSPPLIDGLDVAAVYRPAGDGAEVGGDFYDVFQVGEREWFVVIGDVCGKGIPAALVTAYVRHTVRDLAMQVPDPAELLHRLNAALREHPTDRFCTLVVARLRREGDDWVVLGSLGGHPNPIVRRTDGTAVEVGTHGSLVGIFEQPAFTTFRHTMSDGLLLVYTDGVIEARRDRELYGEGRLMSVVAEGPGEVHALTRRVVEAALDFQGGYAADDIAVLGIQLAAQP